MKALLLRSRGDDVGAATVLGASSPFEAVGGGRPPEPHRAERNELIVELQSALGREAFEAAYAVGAEKSGEETARLFLSSST